MRLFMSSYQTGKHSEEFVEMFGKANKLGVITNAKDYKDADARKVSVNESLEFFNSLGMKPSEIDLREYFNDTKNLQKVVTKYGGLWLCGGNVFLLRRALSYSGLDKYLYDAVRKNDLILGGESAGAIIMGPTLKHSEMEASEDHDGNEDSAFYFAAEYKKEILWDGLDLVNYVPVPHFKSGDYGPVIDEYIVRLNKANIAHKQMTDDQAIMINNAREEFLC